MLSTGWNLINLTRIAPLAAIAQAIAQVPQADRDEVQALVVQELRRLHEGVLARYGLRPFELADWKVAQQML